jgi:hypothetical protein
MTFDPTWIDQEANVNAFWNGLLNAVFTHSYLGAMGSNSYIIAPEGKSPDSSRPLRADFLISRIVRRNLSGTPALIPAPITEVTPILHFEGKGNSSGDRATQIMRQIQTWNDSSSTPSDRGVWAICARGTKCWFFCCKERGETIMKLTFNPSARTIAIGFAAGEVKEYHIISDFAIIQQGLVFMRNDLWARALQRKLAIPLS